MAGTYRRVARARRWTHRSPLIFGGQINFRKNCLLDDTHAHLCPVTRHTPMPLAAAQTTSRGESAVCEQGVHAQAAACSSQDAWSRVRSSLRGKYLPIDEPHKYVGLKDGYMRTRRRIGLQHVHPLQGCQHREKPGMQTGLKLTKRLLCPLARGFQHLHRLPLPALRVRPQPAHVLPSHSVQEAHQHALDPRISVVSSKFDPRSYTKLNLTYPYWVLTRHMSYHRLLCSVLGVL